MCVAWPRKAALIGSSCLPARLPRLRRDILKTQPSWQWKTFWGSCIAVADAVAAERWARDDSAPHRQCPVSWTKTTCVSVCVCVLINCESKIDVAFFLFIVVCERATVRVCVCCVGVRVNVCESLPRSYGCFRGPLWGHLCFYFINDSCAAYEDV